MDMKPIFILCIFLTVSAGARAAVYAPAWLPLDDTVPGFTCPLAYPQAQWRPITTAPKGASVMGGRLDFQGPVTGKVSLKFLDTGAFMPGSYWKLSFGRSSPFAAEGLSFSYSSLFPGGGLYAIADPAAGFSRTLAGRADVHALEMLCSESALSISLDGLLLYSASRPAGFDSLRFYARAPVFSALFLGEFSYEAAPPAPAPEAGPFALLLGGLPGFLLLRRREV